MSSYNPALIDKSKEINVGWDKGFKTYFASVGPIPGLSLQPKADNDS